MKMLRCLTWICILFTSSICQGQDSLDDLVFDTPFEATMFEKYKTEHAFDLLYSIDYEQADSLRITKHKLAFYKHLSELKEKLNRKNNKKNAKIIYNGIHDRYFSKYIINPVFSDIFTAREYNCVTATALYAIAMEYLDIPYEIREMPTHVYLIAYPNEDKIVFESTNPADGLQNISNRQIKRYKDSMIANKMLTEEEAQDDQFFSRYFLTDSTINLQQLIGIQYYNNSIKHIETENYNKGITQIEKAYFLYPNPYTLSWLNLLLIDIAEKTESHSPSEVCSAFSKLYNYNIDEIKKDNAFEKDFFVLYLEQSEKLSKRNGGDSLVLQIGNCIRDQIKNDTVALEIERISHLILANSLYFAADYERSLQHLIKGYDKDNNSLNAFIIECLGRKFSEISNPEQGLDTIKHYEAIFPFTRENKHIRGYKAWCYLKIIHTHFELDEEKEGSQKLQQFQSDFKPEDDILFPEDMVGFGFGSASSYYVRQRDYKKAESILVEGLKYAPYSLNLKRKLKLIREDFGE